MRCKIEGIEFELDVPVIMAAMRRVISHEGHRFPEVQDPAERARMVSTEYRTVIEAVKQVIELERVMFEIERREMREEVQDADEVFKPTFLSLGKQARRRKEVRGKDPKGEETA